MPLSPKLNRTPSEYAGTPLPGIVSAKLLNTRADGAVTSPELAGHGSFKAMARDVEICEDRVHGRTSRRGDVSICLGEESTVRRAVTLAERGRRKHDGQCKRQNERGGQAFLPYFFMVQFFIPKVNKYLSRVPKATGAYVILSSTHCEVLIAAVCEFQSEHLSCLRVNLQEQEKT